VPLLIIASLIPWFALTVEGYTLKDINDKRTRVPTDDSGSSLLNAALVLLVNIVEADASTLQKLRSSVVEIPDVFRTNSTNSRTKISFVEVLTLLFLQCGGAGNDDDEKDTISTEEHVTADMIKSHTERLGGDGEDLILQAYTGLLLAFLIQDQPALRAEIVSRFPTPSLKPLAETLERFHAFHESLNSLSSSSSDRLLRVVKWLHAG
jgi:hypothetical protein